MEGPSELNQISSAGFEKKTQIIRQDFILQFLSNNFVDILIKFLIFHCEPIQILHMLIMLIKKLNSS